MSEETTGTYHSTPSSPPGSDGEIPEAITGELRTTITSMQKIKREVLDHLSGLADALDKLNDGLSSLSTLVERVEKLEVKVEAQDKDIAELKRDVSTLKKHYYKNVTIG